MFSCLGDHNCVADTCSANRHVGETQETTNAAIPGRTAAHGIPAVRSAAISTFYTPVPTPSLLRCRVTVTVMLSCIIWQGDDVMAIVFVRWMMSCICQGDDVMTLLDELRPAARERCGVL